MAISRVKRKLPIVGALGLLSVVTAVLSWARLFPSNWVENGYSRHLFPTISHIAGFMADAIGLSWMDLEILGLIAVLVVSVRRRSWRLPLGVMFGAYLIFFWGWGLNYHRLPLESRLGLVPMKSAEPVKEIDDTRLQWIADTATELNRLWPIAVPLGSTSSDVLQGEASLRVRRVLHLIDGTDWGAASRIKHSYLADWWFRSAGIEGVFNPYGHEPVVAGGLSDFELPFLTAHELAHVHGVADEGDANFIAFLAAVESDDPRFQYSAMFELWLHLGGPVALLDPGPVRDLQTYVARIRSQEIAQAARLQSAILDSHLKANGVREGTKSYSRLVALASATRSRWKDFR